MASSADAIASVAPHVTVMSVSGLTGMPYHAAYVQASAARSRLAPLVIAYWLTSSAMARAAACFRTSGEAKFGNPCARLMASCSLASRVMPRITDSVKPCVRRAVCIRRNLQRERPRRECRGLEVSNYSVLPNEMKSAPPPPMMGKVNLGRPKVATSGARDCAARHAVPGNTIAPVTSLQLEHHVDVHQHLAGRAEEHHAVFAAVNHHAHRRALSLAAPPVATAIPDHHVVPAVLHPHDFVAALYEHVPRHAQRPVVRDRVLLRTLALRRERGRDEAQGQQRPADPSHSAHSFHFSSCFAMVFSCMLLVPS